MRKVDFWAGSHGQFLTFILNAFSNKRKYNWKKGVFDETGACHIPIQSGFHPTVTCGHFSLLHEPWGLRDRVVEIHLETNDIFTLEINTLLRANCPLSLDIVTLDNDTRKKIQSWDRSGSMLKQLERYYGVKDDYQRWQLCQIWCKKFSSENTARFINSSFNFTGPKYKFPFGAFYNYSTFVDHCRAAAEFFEIDFVPNYRLGTTWQEFIERNQGYHRRQVVDNIVDKTLKRICFRLPELDIVSTAYVIYRLEKEFYPIKFQSFSKAWPESSKAFIDHVRTSL